MTLTGEDKAWEDLAACPPEDVCWRAGADYREDGCFELRSLGQRFVIAPADRTLQSTSGDGEIMLTRYRYFSYLSYLVYLGTARDVTPSGRWVSPAELKSSEIYAKGSHVLPLDRLCARFDGQNDGAVEAFVSRGERLGGERLRFGDASVQLHPLPKVPVALILWRSDDEFPARADLLLDWTCELHLPADILWCVTMLSVLMMLS